ncbi:unannotated protein [freshwater metagenome]|uniref:Unannotated protein n=1 Tax=freshwater metagenome TaxID=449393 RepID=A0A6J6IJB9_9ZZZZ
MAQEVSLSRPPESDVRCQVSHMPANANGQESFDDMYTGCFFFRSGCETHSKNPSTGMMHRLRRKADRNDGFEAAVSDRALIIRDAPAGS